MDEQEGSICSVAFHFNSSTNSLQVGCVFLHSTRKQTLQDAKTHAMTLFSFEDNAADLSNFETLLVRFSPIAQLHSPELSDFATAKEKQWKQKLSALRDTVQIPSLVEYSKKMEDDDTPLRIVVGEEDYFPHVQRLALPEWKLARLACLIMVKCPSFSLPACCARVEFDSLSSFMRLDSSTTRALNLFPEKGEGNKECSLFGLLDHTVTKKLGSRLLYKWIKYPLCSKTEILFRQQRVERLVENTESREELRTMLKSVPDLDAISKRLANNKASLEDLYIVYLFAQRLGGIVDCIDTLQVFPEELHRLQDLTNTGKFAQYCEFVESVLDLDSAPREFLVRSAHDSTGELQSLVEQRDALDTALNKARDELKNGDLAELEPKWETDVKMIKTHGHHFRIPKRFDSTLTRIKTGRTLLVVASGIRWTSHHIADLSEQRVDVASQYQAAQSTFVKEALLVASTYQTLVDMVACVLAELDCYASLAHVAATCPVGEYTKPLLSDDRMFAPNARHAMLELQQNVCDSFIPNTHDMSQLESRLQILTGPNMSGKSTFARQLGVLCVMTQIGSFLPCSSQAEMCIVDAVLARVGASDSQLTGVSTFMCEMNETSSILSTVTDRSLVIIDELGRGTSTYDGFGLAWAISEHLAQRSKCWVIFATHFQELTALADTEPGVTNIHVDASVDDNNTGDGVSNIVMLHKVKPGKSLNSFGVNIARMAGFPKDVVSNAQQKLNELDKFKAFTVSKEEDGKQEPALKRLKQLVQFVDREDCLDLVKQCLKE